MSRQTRATPKARPTPSRIVDVDHPHTLPPQAARQPAEEDIRRRAYEIYAARTLRGEPGTPESDWMDAEAELRRP